MGLLTEGNPLSWTETKNLAEHVRKHGITQFINSYRRLKDREGDVLKWGDEVSFDMLQCLSASIVIIAISFIEFGAIIGPVLYPTGLFCISYWTHPCLIHLPYVFIKSIKLQWFAQFYVNLYALSEVPPKLFIRKLQNASLYFEINTTKSKVGFRSAKWLPLREALKVMWRGCLQIYRDKIYWARTRISSHLALSLG